MFAFFKNHFFISAISSTSGAAYFGFKPSFSIIVLMGVSQFRFKVCKSANAFDLFYSMKFSPKYSSKLSDLVSTIFSNGSQIYFKFYKIL